MTDSSDYNQPSTPVPDISITVLPTSCRLVHIPRTRLPSLSHHVTKQLLSPSPTYLNITSNSIELSIFAEESSLHELSQVAKRDKRLSKGSSSYSNGSGGGGALNFDKVEISEERWKVLIVESHDDHLGDAGARVREISAPLAKAGISILYQSSYMSDFILVQSTRLKESISLLCSAGFDFYTSSPGPPTSSPSSLLLHNNNNPHKKESSTELYLSLSSRTSLSIPPSPPPPTAPPSIPTSTSTSNRPSNSTVNSNSTINPNPKPSSPSPLRPHSLHHHPHKLAMVGLTTEQSDVWTSKLIKLLVYPELVRPSSSSFTSALAMGREDEDDVSDLELEDDGGEERGGWDNSTHSTPSLTSRTSSSSHSRPPHSLLPLPLPSSSPYPLPTSTSPSCIPSPSANPTRRRGSDPPFFSLTKTKEGTSLTTSITHLAAVFPKEERWMLLCADELDEVDVNGRSRSRSRSGERGRRKERGELRVALEEPEPLLLDPSDRDRDRVEGLGLDCFGGSGRERSVAEGGGGVKESGSTLTCLQVDLRDFGLDKHGLVNRFSEILHASGINCFYSSTFKTANLLVSQADARRALNLLRSM